MRWSVWGLKEGVLDMLGGHCERFAVFVWEAQEFLDVFWEAGCVLFRGCTC